MAGFSGTSNLEAGRRYGLATIGTAAHAFTLLHDDEEQAFASQVASAGPGTTLLVDTYDVTRGVERAVKIAGTDLGAVRLDSGDLGVLAQEVRGQLDALGATSTRITVTSDLDEYAIASLAASPVDSYGVGTKLVTGSGAPTCGMVYKLVAREGASGALEPVAKASTSKTSVGGRKSASRLLDESGRALAEVVLTGTGDLDPGDLDPAGVSLRPLHTTLVTGGVVEDRWTGPEGVVTATARHAASRDELPRGARRLSTGEVAIPTLARTLGS